MCKKKINLPLLFRNLLTVRLSFSACRARDRTLMERSQHGGHHLADRTCPHPRQRSRYLAPVLSAYTESSSRHASQSAGTPIADPAVSLPHGRPEPPDSDFRLPDPSVPTPGRPWSRNCSPVPGPHFRPPAKVENVDPGRWLFVCLCGWSHVQRKNVWGVGSQAVTARCKAPPFSSRLHRVSTQPSFSCLTVVSRVFLQYFVPQVGIRSVRVRLLSHSAGSSHTSWCSWFHSLMWFSHRLSFTSALSTLGTSPARMASFWPSCTAVSFS